MIKKTFKPVFEYFMNLFYQNKKYLILSIFIILQL